MRRWVGPAVLVAFSAALSVTRSSGSALAGSPSPSAVHPVTTTSAGQAVVVSASGLGSSSAVLTGYRWDGSRWLVAVPAIQAEIGEKGFTAAPHEADGYTPVGEYSFTTLFGRDPNPGVAMPYRQSTSNDHWVDDSSSPVYNTWRSGPAAGRWSSAEDLSNYGLAAAFDFNQDPVVAGGNSAIFLHAWSGATPGCVVVARSDLLAVARWLDPAAHPVIVLGVGVAPPPHVMSTTETNPPVPADEDVSAAASPPPHGAKPDVSAVAFGARRVDGGGHPANRHIREAGAALLAVVVAAAALVTFRRT